MNRAAVTQNFLSLSKADTLLHVLRILAWKVQTANPKVRQNGKTPASGEELFGLSGDPGNRSDGTSTADGDASDNRGSLFRTPPVRHQPDLQAGLGNVAVVRNTDRVLSQAAALLQAPFRSKRRSRLLHHSTFRNNRRSTFENQPKADGPPQAAADATIIHAEIPYADALRDEMGLFQRHNIVLELQRAAPRKLNIGPATGRNIHVDQTTIASSERTRGATSNRSFGSYSFFNIMEMFGGRARVSDLKLTYRVQRIGITTLFIDESHAHIVHGYLVGRWQQANGRFSTLLNSYELWQHVMDNALGSFAKRKREQADAVAAILAAANIINSLLN
ncbi:hypothetical protein RvY_04424 [Ramazzottius varieornatus]|uniref:Uncharacterized protein n=1 Tax=Ramazzottius varieornatus TaxID=947166 RepID=A0A1D1V1J7_RAMVA|nr:hypothetical protein RvY_04424 [Ramazzottius varieornatus]